MGHVKIVVDREARELVRLLEAVETKLDTIEMLYMLSDETEGIVKSELNRLIRLCETDEIGILKHRVETLTKTRVEGRIHKANNDRFRLGEHEFTSGSYIEVYSDEDGWEFGRVEHSQEYGGYYFYNVSGYGGFALRNGMVAAYRS